MPVIRVLAQADVGDDHPVESLVPELADRTLDDAVLRRSLGAAASFSSGDAEEENGPTPASPASSAIRQPIHRPTAYAGHGWDLGGLVLHLGDEQREDE